MANRLDHLAQKLLDDLRTRKEKLGLSSASRQRKVQEASTVETNRSSHRSFHGGRTTENKINAVSMDIIQMLSRRQSKTALPAGTSQDIVPFGRSANRPNSVDVSMALALALGNNGKLRNLQLFSNIAVGNERIMHRGSLYLGGRNSQRLPTKAKNHQMDLNSLLTSLHEGGISVGIQQLNSILQAYSSGSKFTRESIEIGRELLRGAMDLEESLKMLIIVQDASDFMVGSQGKHVRLLKGAEEDNVKHKKATRCGSSCDGSSRLLQKLLAKENGNDIKQGQRTLAPFQSRRSVTMSYNSLSIPESQQAGARKHAQNNELSMFSDSNRNLAASENFPTKNMNPSLRGGKVRMSNVIAKLMGLEELPVIKPETNKEKEEIDRESTKEIDQILKAGAGKVKSLQRNVRRDAGKRVLLEKHVDEIKLASGIEDNCCRGKTHLMHSQYIEKSTRKDNSHKIHVTMDKKVEDSNKDDSVRGSTRMKHVIPLKDKINEQEEERIYQDSNRIFSEKVQNKTVKRSQCQDEKVHKKDALKEQKKDQERSTLASNQINVFKASPCKPIAHRVNPNCAIQGVAKEAELHGKIKLKLNGTRSTEQKVANEEKSTCKVAVNKSISGKHDKVEQTRENTKNIQVKNPRSSCTYLQSDMITGRRSLADKPLATKIHKTMPQVPLTPIVKQADISSSENMEIMAEDRSQKYKKTGKDLNHQAPSSHELKHIWVERNSQTKEITPHDPASAQYIGVTVPAKIPPLGARWRSQVKEKRLHTETNTSHSTNQRNHQKSEGLLNPTSEVESFNSKEMHQADQISDRQFEKYSKKSEVSEQKKQGLLTKNLSMFTRQLMHNQQFLNTAKAIFELEIPTGLVRTIESAFQKDESKLLLDSGLEFLQRKGKREEDTFNIMRSNAHLKVRSFSELIKELNDDIESLNLPSRPGDDCLDAAEFLCTILERDVHNMNPDCNCMWDFGWNSSTFAVMEKEEIVLDAAKQILDALICEITRELTSATINASSNVCSNIIGRSKLTRRKIHTC